MKLQPQPDAIEQQRTQSSPQQQTNQQIDKYNELKTRIFGIILILFQILLIVLHAKFIKPVQIVSSTFKMDYLTLFGPFVISIASSLGFGLLFSYNKRLILSGLGFSLFICGYSLLLYPMVQVFWSSSGIFPTTSIPSAIASQSFFLSSHTLFKNTTQYIPNENTIEGCFKSAIAINVATSSVIGRIALTEVWIIIVIGTLGYQFNRRLNVMYFGDDAFGTMSIFTFAGFMGLAVAIIIRLKQKAKANTEKHPLFTSSMFSSTLALLGSAILLICLPFLTFFYQKNFTYNPYLQYSPVLNMILAGSQGLMGSIILSLLIKSKINIRDFIYGPIAGLIISGASSYFTLNMAYTMGIGIAGGAIQACFHHTLQIYFTIKSRPFTTISFALFGIQGLLGCFAACTAKFVVQNNSTGLLYISLGYQTVKLLWFGLVSSAIGFGFGLIIGFICYFTHKIRRQLIFNDYYQWRYQSILDQQDDDGLSQQKYKNPRINTQDPRFESMPTMSVDSNHQTPY